MVFISSIQFSVVLTAQKKINYENKGYTSIIDFFSGKYINNFDQNLNDKIQYIIY